MKGEDLVDGRVVGAAVVGDMSTGGGTEAIAGKGHGSFTRIPRLQDRGSGIGTEQVGGNLPGSEVLLARVEQGRELLVIS